MEKDRKKVVAVIPAYNEALTIGSIILETKKYVDEIIVVDDGSKDNTYEIACLSNVNVLQHTHNLGKGAALKTGIQYAQKKLNADIIVCFDADGQHFPAHIPIVLEPIYSEIAELVLASRFLDKRFTEYIPGYRRFGLKILNFLTNISIKNKITDSQNGFRAFTADVANLFKFTQTGFTIESEMLENASDNNIRMKEVSLPAKYEGLDTSTLPARKHGFKVLSYLISLIRDKHPLLFFSIPGALLVGLGLIVGIYTMDFYFKHGWLPLVSTVISVGAGFTGALLLFIGLTLSAISRIITIKINEIK